MTVLNDWDGILFKLNLLFDKYFDCTSNIFIYQPAQLNITSLYPFHNAADFSTSNLYLTIDICKVIINVILGL